MPQFRSGRPRIQDGAADTTLKACIPFYDAMTNGYTQEAWQDMSFEFTIDGDGNDFVQYNTASMPAAFDVRSAPSLSLPPEYYPFEFVLHPPYFPEMPKGWSILITQPLNAFDSPFTFTSGIIDSDNFTHSVGGNLPFYIKRGFSGVITKGTPLFQMIPVKRENWKSEVTEFDARKQAKSMSPIHTKFWGGYKHAYWEKKSFK